ncbi:hypothetical protein HU200_045957 [Digitaria exilis]|uniref:X8 domain-containing protein n=1 Tax=Digitaria exilis TaxID=1010633 RepID=A0A835AYP8_9POAL|nr:hypothetical protein HU200_045957 [Digitaria exilis]
MLKPQRSHAESTVDSSEVDKRRSLAATLFCVAIQGADPAALQAGLNYACGPGHADCTAIQPGGPCYKQNNLQALASYAYNDYYQRSAKTANSCDFNGTATTTPNDPMRLHRKVSMFRVQNTAARRADKVQKRSSANTSEAGGGTPAASAPSGLSPFTPTPGAGGFGNGSFGSPTSGLVPFDGAESLMSGARWALCSLLLVLPLFFFL